MSRPEQYFSQFSTSLVDESSVLLRQGEEQSNAFYLISGILKACHYTDSGIERCKEFYFPQSLCLLFSSWIENRESRYQIESVTKVEYIRVPISMLHSQEWVNARIQLLEQQLLYKEKKESFFLLDTHEERYKYLINHFPHWINNLTSIDIANYMGISPVSLSRIKSRINNC
ncbi:Crp/Fnr family transcriptional regulator [Vibrio sp. DBSS07]|uniref:Crp/Fnr family transcriptional regulator n=1 Tax=Vibrio paucivorans TaxID=2829489 RepID=A0A9X3HV30_9VIBR|nr:Crp/Fnr family transcriptional regulator [Vibrio paucivorans]